MNRNTEQVRQRYINNPPDGMTPGEIHSMSDEALLDMDYFLNEDDHDDEIGSEGFYIF